jgi:tetratricopeptide (TPR) repeat protein
MKCPFKVLLFILPIAAVILSCSASICGTPPASQTAKPAVSQTAPPPASKTAKPAAEAKDDEEESPPDYELWYNCYQDAIKETGVVEIGKKLIGCIKTYPTASLMPNYVGKYKELLAESSDNKKYQELETLGELWLTLPPDENDYDTKLRIADAAWNLKHYDLYFKRAIEIYKMKPISSLAEGIAGAFKITGNKAKYIEWTETAIKLPENEANFTLRLNLVRTYMEEPKNYSKIMEWAQEALKAALLVKDPSKDTQAQLVLMRHFCHDLIGKILMDQDKKYPEAIKSFKQALKVKDYVEGYYYIGWCLHAQYKADIVQSKSEEAKKKADEKADEAMLWYAKTWLWCENKAKECGEFAAKAKENLENIYKPQHDNSTFAIQKIYDKAKAKTDWISDEK